MGGASYPIGTGGGNPSRFPFIPGGGAGSRPGSGAKNNVEVPDRNLLPPPGTFPAIRVPIQPSHLLVSRGVTMSKLKPDDLSDPVLRTLTPGQLTRLGEVMESLLSSSEAISSMLQTLCSNAELLGRFNEALSLTREAVGEEIRLTMQDPEQFPVQKVYHTEYHALEMYHDVGMRYEGHPLGALYATLAFAHDLIQGNPPPGGSARPENECQTADIVIQKLTNFLSGNEAFAPHLNALSALVRAVIVQGTYLVGFKEAEGVLGMRLLETYQTEAGNDKKIALLKPVLEALSVLSICDIHRVSFQEVRDSHRVMLADGGFEPGEDATIAMKYWASHSVRMAGELGRYQLSDTLDADGTTGAYRRLDSATSDYFDLFNRVRAAFVSAPGTVDSLLEQPVRKFQRLDGGQERWGPAIPFYELLYTHLVDDRVFIATKNPGEAGLSYRRLFGEESSRLSVDSEIYKTIVERHQSFVAEVATSDDESAASIKRQFIKEVLCGATFQEGYRLVHAGPGGYTLSSNV